VNELIFKVMNEKNSVQRWLSRKMFRLPQAFGFQVVADHFYEVIPNTKYVEHHYVDTPRHCAGLALQMAPYEEFACAILDEYLPDFLNCERLLELGFQPSNPYYHGFDTAILFGVIRHFKPCRIVEVGQGMSTRIAMAAMNMNWQETGQRATLISIDPYQRIAPGQQLEGIDIQYYNTPVQSTDVGPLRELSRNDLLFIDSSHVFKFGSDVQFEFERVYPILGPGVIVHVHDIFTPFDYPKHWIVHNKWFWNEQYYLEQFLAYNKDFRIILPSHYVTKLSSRVQDLWRERSGEQGSMAWWKGGPHESASSFYIQRI